VTANISRRDYAGTVDFDPLLRFTQRIYTPDSRWHIGDIAWDLGFEPGGEPDSRMSFWERDGEIVGWGWLRLPSTVALLVDPDHTDRLVDEIVDWATAVAGGPVSVGVLETEKALVEPLVRQGREPGLPDHFFLNMQRELSDLPPVPDLPPGFVVRPVEPGEVAARAGLHRAVWKPNLTDEIFAAMSSRWPYRREFDRVAVAPDGRLVSYILGWYDDVNRVGEFEPVGTLPEFRRQGLSRAVAVSLLHAFRDAGAQRALVYARGDDGYPVPRQVYGALGFRTHGRVVQYRLPDDGSRGAPGTAR
jgi:GNAT superfamily N-acetyltransferase